jgi:hypothetical protein
LLITIYGWSSDSGVYHEVPGLENHGRIRAEVGANQSLLQARGEDRQERLELYSIEDGSIIPRSLDDFGFVTLTTGSIQ